ncbi:roquin-1-like isoform X2 [Salvelinus sp. IW2-2015]|uniref:roquin-1-like isoform X2 n=1 Tax=Salvelinus sp. IW2-2015 TaxID=2691554 RepID=UPI000CDFA4D3|nr:roquin-1-like isoform X2 [Salvelinus alpinus]
MPVQAPQWTEFLLCPICTQLFEESVRKPISLGCGHTVCKMCLNKLHRKACPFDQTAIASDIELLPVNTALLQLVGGQVPKRQPTTLLTGPEDIAHYEEASDCVEELALYLKPLSNSRGLSTSGAQSSLSRPMQRKLVTLVHCQLVEEEGRVRATRAARSLGERTVTELILQHQNPQQLSSNLWAAVRARGCQFLGPAMQEEALKLVLLALEDGSALSRKVLVLFVVQRLEPRFPQASKTSIGHVVQLLYRASCFKVTKRDEDSSLMQLKEEFRTYEALRREHDSQIVQIAMEGGLRIAPDQWSSLLYGDQSHKSHMQSIIDKLQTPASFAQSVQELTIALQRTGDPANLNRLRPHLELLANIDPSPDSPPPTWELLDTGLVAVKTVVHGLVDFIQNHSKKGSDTQQPPQHSKYKTYMCRDMKQKGGCPRGASCTFAHSQDELEKYRKMNKRLAARRPLSLSLTQLNEVGLLPEEVGMMEGLAHKGLTNGMVASVTGSALPQLISRGADPSYEPIMRKPQSQGSHSAPGSPPDLLDPVPNRSMAYPRMAVDHLAMHKPVPRGPPMYPSQQGEHFYPPEPRAPPSAMQYESTQYPPGNPSYPYQTSQYLPQPRYVRNLPPPNDPATPTYPESPYPGTYPQEHECPPPPQPSGPHFSNANPHGYPPPPHYDGRRHPSYPPPPPQTYPHREEPSSMPADEASRERYPPEGYQPTGPHPGHMRPYATREDYSRPQPTPTLDYLHRRRQEIMAQLEDRKQVTPPPFAPSPTLPHTYESNYTQEQYMENSQVFAKYREPDYASQYSPWSCDTIGSYIGSKEGKSKDSMERINTEGKGAEGQRRSAEARDDDPIIPFGSLPTVSRFGVISRTPKTGYQMAGPGQAVTPSQGTNSPKHTAATADYPYGNGAGWGVAPYTQPPQAHLSERPVQEREQLTMELQQVNRQINKQTAQAAQPSPGEWSSGSVSSQQLSLELHHVEREIGKRTRQIALENHVSHDGSGAYKLKPTENKMQREEHSLVLSEGCNGSSCVLLDGSVASSVLSCLTSKTSSLSLSSDLPTTGGTDRQENIAIHPCS